MSLMMERIEALENAHSMRRAVAKKRNPEPVLLVAFVLAIIAITGLPYLYAYVSTPSGLQFMGIILNVPDTAQYLSWARESMHTIFIQNKLTPEQGPAVYFNLFWLVVGRLAAAVGVGPVEATQMVRPVAGAVYITAIYWFTGLIFANRLQRWTSTIVAVLGGGLGWLLVLDKQLTHATDVAFPLDLYVTEPNTFLSIMAFPLQAMAGGLLVFSLGLAALALERSSVRLAAISGITGALLGLQHGYDLVVIYALVGTVVLARLLLARGNFRPMVLAVLVCGPSVPTALYNLYITSTSPVWKGALAQYGNAGVFTPPPPHLIILLGLPLVITIAGLVAGVRGATWSRVSEWTRTAAAREQLVLVWLVVGFVLLYIPTGYQIKMLVGWQIPLSILATRTVFRVTAHEWWGRRLTGRTWAPACVAGLFIFSVLPTNAYLFTWRFVDLGRHEYPYYLHQDEVKALDWLAGNSAASDVVLSSLTVGQYVPSISENNAFLAHWAMTLDYYSKRNMVEAFFQQQLPDAARSELMRDFNVRFVFYGPAERELGPYNPDLSRNLARVYANAEVVIYKVSDSEAVVSHG